MFNNSGDNNADLVSDENDDRNYFLLKTEYESTMVFIKEFYSEIGRLTDVCKDHEKKLHVCEEKEENLKEEIITLITQLEESKRLEEVNCSKRKYRKDYVEALEGVIEKLRKDVEERTNSWRK